MRHPSIRFRPNSPSATIRRDYLDICDGNHCAAMVLAQMQFWYEVKLAHLDQAVQTNDLLSKNNEPATQDTELWIYKKQAEMQVELFALFGLNNIGTAYAFLIERGYLETRQNPRFAWDKTRQYLFCADIVQSAIDALPDHGYTRDHGHRSFNSKASIPRNQSFKDLELTLPTFDPKATIPEITTEITTDTTTDLSKAFARFWSIYPRKVGREGAFKAWQKLNPDAALVAQIMDAIPKWIEWREQQRRSGQWVPEEPHASTWLNGKRWQDEHSSAPSVQDRTMADVASDMNRLVATLKGRSGGKR